MAVLIPSPNICLLDMYFLDLPWDTVGLLRSEISSLDGLLAPHSCSEPLRHDAVANEDDEGAEPAEKHDEQAVGVGVVALGVPQVGVAPEDPEDE